ncbi:MAG: sulfatase [Polyangiaceae bacterium]|nr:sulfatase [Polyangiaceae bacterium]
MISSRGVGRLIVGALLGAGYVAALALVVARRAASDTRVLGVEAAHVTRAIVERFPDHVASAARLVASLAVVEGALVGAAAAAVLELRELAQQRSLGRRAWLPLLVLIPLAHLAHLTWAMAWHPALFSEAFYEAGGARRLLQVVVTDQLGPGGVVVAWTAASTLFVLGGQRARASWSRLRARARGLGALAGALGAFTVIVWAWPASRPRAAARSRPNVLILAVDSLRTDRVTPRTMPALSRFVAGATSFERAYVSVPRTFPSWVTWLTGRWPHEHGVRHMFPSARARSSELRALPARLAEAGYATAVASDYAGDVFPRVSLGFQRVDTPTFHFGELIRHKALESQPPVMPLLTSRLGRWLAPTTRGLARLPDARDVADRALGAIDAAGDRPFFVVAFFGDAHFPYAITHEDRAGLDRAYRGRFKYEKQNRLGRDAPPDDADVAQIRALYDGATRAVDRGIARALAGLRARGLEGSTVVIVTADHGEALLEHGRGQGHGDHLFGEDVLRVPLVIRDGRAPRPARIDAVVRDVDLAPTVAELVGVDAEGATSGASLAPALRGEALPARDAFSETGLWFTEDVDGVPRALRLPYPDVSRMLEVERDRGDDVVLAERWAATTTMAKHRALTTATHRLVLMPTRGGLRERLFDLSRDPG